VSELPNAMATAEDEFLAKEIEMLSDDLSIDLQQYLDDISTVGNIVTIKKARPICRSTGPTYRH
jgi:hypothetical protein